jgi:dihydroorotate dehydrogenase
MGFNSKGADFFLEQLNQSKEVLQKAILGINVGKNKLSKDPVGDYTKLLTKFYDVANYLVINVSSPNTPGLRDLQNKQELSNLLAAISECRSNLCDLHGVHKPILLKIAPDLTIEQREDIIQLSFDYCLDGIIVGNTTIGERENLASRFSSQSGGLSGEPLFELSTGILRDIYKKSQGKIPLIGAGGISSGQDAYTKLKAGASLIQIYSCIIFHGFTIVNKIKSDLIRLLQKDGVNNVLDIIGQDT